MNLIVVYLLLSSFITTLDAKPSYIPYKNSYEDPEFYTRNSNNEADEFDTPFKKNKEKKEPQKKTDPALLKKIEDFFTYAKTLQDQVASTDTDTLFFPSEREELAPLFKKIEQIQAALAHFGKGKQHKGKRLYLDVLLDPMFAEVCNTIKRIAPQLKKLAERIAKVRIIRTKSDYEPNLELAVPQELVQSDQERQDIIKELRVLGIDQDKKPSALSRLAKDLTKVIASPKAAKQKEFFLKQQKAKEQTARALQRQAQRLSNDDYRNYENQAYSNYYRSEKRYPSVYGSDYNYGDTSHGSGYKSSYGDSYDFFPSNHYDFEINRSGRDLKNKKNLLKENRNDKENKQHERTMHQEKPEFEDLIIAKTLEHDLMKMLIELAATKTIDNNFLKKLTMVYKHPNFNTFIKRLLNIITEILELEYPSLRKDSLYKPTEEVKSKTKKLNLREAHTKFLEKIKSITPVLIWLTLHLIPETGKTEKLNVLFTHEQSTKEDKREIKKDHNLLKTLIAKIDLHEEIKAMDKIIEQYKEAVSRIEKKQKT